MHARAGTPDIFELALYLISAAFSMPAGIYSLPPELLIFNVAECLDTEGLLNLRLSSQILRDCAQHIFVTRHFHHRSHVVTTESLECLDTISRHSAFGPEMPEMCTLTISDHVTGPAHETETTLEERDLIHRSRMIGLFLTRVLKNADNCRMVRISNIGQLWGTAALERETGEHIWWRGGPTQFSLGIQKSVISTLTESRARVMSLDIFTFTPRQDGYKVLQFPPLYRDNRLTQSP